jgi:hypothetical protein
MTRSRHAEVRLQQRAIPPFMVELLERFGSEMRCKVPSGMRLEFGVAYSRVT